MAEQDIQEAEEQPNDPPEVQEPEGGADTDQEVETDGQPQGQQGGGGETDVERHAREWGWVPKAEFKGNPRHWKPAEEYVKRPDDIRRERDDIKRKADALEKQLSMVAGRVEEIEKRGYDRAVEELSAQQYRAAEDGNTEEWQRLEKQRRELKPPAPKPEDGGQQADPVIATWMAERPWTQDQALNLEAAGVLNRLIKAHPHMPPVERLNKVEEIIKRRYPEDFGIDPAQAQAKPNYQRPQKVSGTETRGGSSGNGAAKGWTDIPQEIRESAKSIIGEGRYFKTQADYVKSYFKQYPDG